ncbi:hypothetical protein RISK_003670 [Rhodopirellula islandica]|uniref:Uncharacterized protein n=1 Tax=Rhodopirellula islandica TaxID=595434 RepID=A0A0J1EEX8_RHOIS|nr:hypothetical protein RISK_003670 [Rhodopirellula islandica]
MNNRAELFHASIFEAENLHERDKACGKRKIRRAFGSESETGCND